MNVVIIWDNAVFLQQSGGGWKRGEIARIEDAAELLCNHLPRRARVRLIYDPELLTTELEDAPKGRRKIIALALNDRHPALVSDTLAWGFQPQWGGNGGGYSTFLHSENSPGLLILREKLELEKNVQIDGAWPLLTPAMQIETERARACITVIVDGARAFIAGYPVSGARIAMKIRAQDEADMWSGLFDVLKQVGVSLGAERRLPARVKFFTTGSAQQFSQDCPYWADLAARNTVEVQTFDGLAALARSLPRSHPSNLLDSLPSDVHLDGALKLISATMLAAAVAVGFFFWRELDRAETQRRVLETQQAALNAENHRLLTNQQEITNLKLLYGSDVGWSTPGRVEFLTALAEGVSTNATVMELAIAESGEFRVGGLFWSAGENATRESLVTPVALALARAQPRIKIDPAKTSFEAKSGRFTIVGAITKE